MEFLIVVVLLLLITIGVTNAFIALEAWISRWLLSRKTKKLFRNIFSTDTKQENWVSWTAGEYRTEK